EKEVNEKDESICTPRVGDLVHLRATQKNSEEDEDKKENVIPNSIAPFWLGEHDTSQLNPVNYDNQDEILDDVHFHPWDDFCLLPKQPTIIPVVLEFYSHLKFATNDRVYVKHKCIDVSPTTICKYWEAESAKGNEEVMEADDEASKGHKVMTRNETMEDVATSTGLMSRGMDLGEQSTPLRRTK
ncbi:hypothetical protein Godav_002724, partial [Gossypium davidsonii]|nr:hypothetical protein [Gossypium davidsonii]